MEIVHIGQQNNVNKTFFGKYFIINVCHVVFILINLTFCYLEILIFYQYGGIDIYSCYVDMGRNVLVFIFFIKCPVLIDSYMKSSFTFIRLQLERKFVGTFPQKHTFYFGVPKLIIQNILNACNMLLRID